MAFKEGSEIQKVSAGVRKPASEGGIFDSFIKSLADIFSIPPLAFASDKEIEDYMNEQKAGIEKKQMQSVVPAKTKSLEPPIIGSGESPEELQSRARYLREYYKRTQ